MRIEPVTLIVAPNGARRMPTDHPRLPITPESAALETRAAVEAGAAMVHLHARDAQGKHTLDPAINAAFMEAVRAEMGNDVVIQLTTEAVGQFTPEEQITLIRELKPEAASFAVRELIPTDSDADKNRGREFFSWVHQQGIIAQFILYSDEDVLRYHHLKAEGVLPQDQHHLLFVLGRYSKTLQSEPTDLLPMLMEHSDDTPWAVCAFGEKEHLCAAAGIALGGDVRVGFENNLYDQRGELAESNATLIAQAANNARNMARPLITADQFRSKYL